MTARTARRADHPAKYSAPIVTELAHALARWAPSTPLFPVRVLDPFAGAGGIHQLAAGGYDTVGIEIEPDWAALDQRTICGDATALPFPDSTFDVVATSPCYGNRMADTYDGYRDRCTACRGDGQARTGDGVVLDGEPCIVCDGAGLLRSQRYTYRVALGHDLAPGSAAGLQWGDAYRALHRAAWAEAHRVLRADGVLMLNISDHIRAGRLQGVDLWHAATIGAAGFDLLEQRPISTRRSKNGANRDARAACEWLLVFRKAATE